MLLTWTAWNSFRFPMKNSLTPAIWLSLPLALLALGCANNEANAPAEGGPPSTPEAQEPGEVIGQGVQEQSVRDQKRAILVAQYVESGRMALGDGRIPEAQDFALKAIRLDASDAAARRLHDDVAIAMGNAGGTLDAGQQDVADRQRARMQQLLAEVKAQVDEGEAKLSARDYDSALGTLRLAQANIAGAGFRMDWGDLPTRIETLSEQARVERDMAMEMDRQREIDETYAALQAEGRLSEEQQQQRIDLMFQEALDHFDAEEYDKCANLCDDVLRIDPLHDRAKEVRDSAWRARHKNISRRFVTSRKELFRQWNQDIEEARILQDAILVNPDPERWKELTELRRKYSTTIEDNADSEINMALAAEIAGQRVPSLSVSSETSLETVIDQLRTFTNIPFVVTPDATDAVDSEGIEFNITLAHETSVLNALELITAAAGEDVVYTFRHGVVYITTRAKANSDLVLRPHDVKDLVAQLIDHAGPRINEIRLPDGDYDDEDGGPFGGLVGEPVPIYDPDNLEALIRQSIATGTWDEVEGVSIRFQNGLLFIRHTADVQNEVFEFLQNLRRYTSSMVHIEARFLTITKDYLQEIGVDWRGNGGDGSPLDLADLDDVSNGLVNNASAGFDNNGLGLPSAAAANPSSGAYFDEFGDGDIRARTENILGAYGSRLGANGGMTMQFSFLDDLQYNMILRAVEKRNQAQELQSTFLSAQNTQRAYATMLNQITYVQDFDVEVALAAFIADPVIGVVSDGIVLDVRPTIAHDRKYIMLELRPTVATLVRPLPEFTSSLAGLTTPVTIQLPELQVSSANTTAVVPDGGTVVIGGLKKLFNLEQTSEIPFLGDIRS